MDESKQEIIKSIVDGKTPQDHPVAIIMAGIPGAGKTEFLNHIIPSLPDAVVIDLDNLVKCIPKYKPKDYYRYRRA